MKSRIEKYAGWRDAIELVLAVWLLVSPFVLGFFPIGHASMIAFLIGSIILCTAMLGISTEQPWEEWITFAFALLLIASPWLLSYSFSVIATVNALATGSLLVIVSLFTIKHDYEIRRPTNVH